MCHPCTQPTEPSSHTGHLQYVCYKASSPTSGLWCIPQHFQSFQCCNSFTLSVNPAQVGKYHWGFRADFFFYHPDFSWIIRLTWRWQSEMMTPKPLQGSRCFRKLCHKNMERMKCEVNVLTRRRQETYMQIVPIQECILFCFTDTYLCLIRFPVSEKLSSYMFLEGMM